MRQFIRRDAPDARHVLARLRIEQRALARQLIAFLAVLAAALTIALAGDHGAAAAFAPEVTGGQRQIDQRRAVLDALGLMLQAARVHGDRTVGLGKHVRGFLDRFRRNSGHLRHRPRIVARHGRFNRLEAGGVFLDETVVLQVVPQHDVQHSVEQRQIGAGTQRKEQVGIARDGRHARIGDDQLAAVVAALPDVVGGDGRAFAHVRADHEQHLRFRNFGPRNRTAIHVERELVGDAGGHHAEPSVVVDVSGPQRHTREFAHQVRLLGGERRASINRYRVFAVAVLHLAQTACGEGHGIVPTRLRETAVGAEQRIEQPVGMIRLQVTLDALRAQHSAIEREILPRLEADHVVLPDLELDAALLSAEAAMRLYQPVRY